MRQFSPDNFFLFFLFLKAEVKQINVCFVVVGLFVFFVKCAILWSDLLLSYITSEDWWPQWNDMFILAFGTSQNLIIDHQFCKTDWPSVYRSLVENIIILISSRYLFTAPDKMKYPTIKRWPNLRQNCFRTLKQFYLRFGHIFPIKSWKAAYLKGGIYYDKFDT